MKNSYFPLLFPKELIQEINTVGDFISYEEGKTIFKNKKRLNQNYFMLSGLVKVYLNKDDKNMFLSYHNGSDFRMLNAISTISKHVNTFYYNILKSTDFLILSNQHVSDFFLRYPAFRSHVFDCYQKEYKITLDKLGFHLNATLSEHLWNYLETKASVLNTQEIPYSTTEIAEDLQYSRQSINKALIKLEKENRIQRRINIIDINVT
ncbi:Crp/Fnr family transcriptional regulator [Aquimarina rhabdastrellae]